MRKAFEWKARPSKLRHPVAAANRWRMRRLAGAVGAQPWFKPANRSNHDCSDYWQVSRSFGSITDIVVKYKRAGLGRSRSKRESRRETSAAFLVFATAVKEAGRLLLTRQCPALPLKANVDR